MRAGHMRGLLTLLGLVVGLAWGASQLVGVLGWLVAAH